MAAFQIEPLSTCYTCIESVIGIYVKKITVRVEVKELNPSIVENHEPPTVAR